MNSPDFNLSDMQDLGDLKAGPPPVLYMEEPQTDPIDSTPTALVFPFPKESLDLPTHDDAMLRGIVNVVTAQAQQRRPEFQEIAAASRGAEPQFGAGQTVLPKGWILMGSIESASPVIVAGQVVGDVLMQPSAKVEVRKGGKVDGSLKGTEVVVQGEVIGRVDASNGSVWIEDGARVSGQVIYTRIRMDGGTHKIELTHVAGDSAGSL